MLVLNDNVEPAHGRKHGNAGGIVREVEADDPIDYADLPFGEQELRRLVMSSLVERHHQVEAGNMADLRYPRAVSAKHRQLVLENTVLHARLLLLQGQQVDVRSLLAPFTLKGKS